MSLKENIKKHAITYVIAIYTVIFLAGTCLIGEALIFPFVVCTLGLLCAVTTKLFIDQNAINNARAKDYRQLEALSSLVSVIGLEAPLPPMRGWAASPDYLSLVARNIFASKPKLIVELGSGISTIVAASCLRKIGGGRIVSIEQNEDYCEITREQLRLHGLDEIVRVVHAPIVQGIFRERSINWYDTSVINVEDEIDLLVVDGPSLSPQTLRRYPAIPYFKEHFSKNAVVILDDAARDDEQNCIENWIKECPDMKGEYVYTEKGAYVLRRVV